MHRASEQTADGQPMAALGMQPKSLTSLASQNQRSIASSAASCSCVSGGLAVPFLRCRWRLHQLPSSLSSSVSGSSLLPAARGKRPCCCRNANARCRCCSQCSACEAAALGPPAAGPPPPELPLPLPACAAAAAVRPWSQRCGGLPPGAPHPRSCPCALHSSDGGSRLMITVEHARWANHSENAVPTCRGMSWGAPGRPARPLARPAPPGPRPAAALLRDCSP